MTTFSGKIKLPVNAAINATWDQSVPWVGGTSKLNHEGHLETIVTREWRDNYHWEFIATPQIRAVSPDIVHENDYDKQLDILFDYLDDCIDGSDTIGAVFGLAFTIDMGRIPSSTCLGFLSCLHVVSGLYPEIYDRLCEKVENAIHLKHDGARELVRPYTRTRLSEMKEVFKKALEQEGEA